ncbi:hypothetical protein C1H46_039978 [Malus baccata]|uniref:Uncharacterized protein n=1 Tax=Malus baccata TaxID=106549 RepID=A0A540KJT1_MALBA|nr:hypothetical protein C1H46_039978 [Malus baccata]
MREEGKNRNPVLCVISPINSHQAPSLFLAFTELKPTIFSNRNTEAFEVMAGRNHAIAQKLKTWCRLHCSSLFSKNVFGSPVARKVFRASPFDTSSTIL